MSTHHTLGVDASKVVEEALTGTLKPAGFRKRARNWFRTTDTGLYQLVNLQMSSWGSGDCYLNLGWDPEANGFVAENSCMARIRAEKAGVVPRIELPRADGYSMLELPGISLLDRDVFERFSAQEYLAWVLEVIVEPVAGLLNRTRSVVDLVPLFTGHPGWAVRRLRDHLATLGHELPTTH